MWIFVAIALGMLIVAALVYRRTPLRLMTAAPTWRWQWLGLGLTASLALQATALAFVLGLAPPDAWMPSGWSTIELLLFCGAALATVTAFVVAEEVLCRAWLVRPGFQRKTVLVALLVASCLAFAAFHLRTEPLHIAMHLVSGAAYGWSVVRLGGLEFAIGAHVGRNILVLVWVDMAGRSLSEPQFEAALIANMVISILLLGVVEIAARRSSVRDRVRGVAVVEKSPSRPA